MEIFEKIVEVVGRVPEWVAFLACPAALVLIALTLALLGGKKAYWGLVAIVCGTGFFLVACKAGTETALLYFALTVVMSGILRLFLFLPRIGKKKGKKHGAREDKIYEKFHEPLAIPFARSRARICGSARRYRAGVRNAARLRFGAFDETESRTPYGGGPA